jgi:dUTPase
MPRHPLSTTVKFKRLHPEATLPAYVHEGDSDMDLKACIPDDARKLGIPPGESRLVDCGFEMQLGEGYAAHLMSTAAGPLVQAWSENPWQVCLVNPANTTRIIHHGDIIARMRILAVARASTVED